MGRLAKQETRGLGWVSVGGLASLEALCCCLFSPLQLIKAATKTSAMLMASETQIIVKGAGN